MKNLKFLPILALATFLLIGGLTANAEAAKFQINNLSGVDIHYIYISNNDSGGWGGDLLGNSVLKASSTWSINLPSNAPRLIKVKLVFANGSDYTWRRIDCYQISQMSIVRNSDGSMSALYGGR